MFCIEFLLEGGPTNYVLCWEYLEVMLKGLQSVLEKELFVDVDPKSVKVILISLPEETQRMPVSISSQKLLKLLI